MDAWETFSALLLVLVSNGQQSKVNIRLPMDRLFKLLKKEKALIVNN